MDEMTAEVAKAEDVETTEVAETEEVAPAEDVAEDAPESDDVGEGADATEELEEVEIDFGGNKRAFKKNATVAEIHGELQDYAKSLYSDYISKTQQAAEIRKRAEQQAQDLEMLGSVSQEYHITLGRAMTAQQELNRLRQIDLNALWNANPDQARRVSDMLRQKEVEVMGYGDALQAAELKVTKSKQELVERTKAEGKARIEKVIPEFSTRHLSAVVDYISSNYSITKEDALDQWAAAPDVTVMAWKAMQYDKAAKAAKRPVQKTASKPVAPQPARPGPRKVELVSKEADQMPVSKWIELRNQQLAKRR